MAQHLYYKKCINENLKDAHIWKNASQRSLIVLWLPPPCLLGLTEGQSELEDEKCLRQQVIFQIYQAFVTRQFYHNPESIF